MKYCPKCRSEDIHETLEVWKPEGYKAFQCGKCGYSLWTDELGHIVVPALRGRDPVNLNLKRFPITINAYEAGILISMIWKQPEELKRDLAAFFEELRKLQRTVRKEGGVEVTELPNGKIRMVDPDGTEIVRPKHPWEVGP